MTNTTIPPAALEAAAKAMWKTDDPSQWELGMARAACRAMLKHWPGMHIHEWQRPWLGGMSGTDIILPLTEHTND